MSRGPEKQFDPELALKQAMQLFWAKGYTGTGLSELLETMKIGRKSMYDTFGNKRELYIKALQHYSQTVVNKLHRDLNNSEQPALENVRKVLHAIATVDSRPMSMGCFLGVSIAQFRTNDSEMAEVLRKHMQRVEKAFYLAFKKAQDNGELKQSTNVRDLARLFVSIMQGMSLIGRVIESPGVPRSIVKSALATLEAA